jgi:hypothetical protein
MMSNSIMAIKRTAAACALSGAALAWLLVPMAAAADGLPSPSHGTDSASTECPAPACKRMFPVHANLPPFASVAFPKFTCPSDHPWLKKGDVSPGRIVPNGIKVVEKGGVGVTIHSETRDSHNLVTGYPAGEGSAFNWTFEHRNLKVYAYCTNNRDDAYVIPE